MLFIFFVNYIIFFQVGLFFVVIYFFINYLLLIYSTYNITFSIFTDNIQKRLARFRAKYNLGKLLK